MPLTPRPAPFLPFLLATLTALPLGTAHAQTAPDQPAASASPAQAAPQPSDGVLIKLRAPAAARPDAEHARTLGHLAQDALTLHPGYSPRTRLVRALRLTDDELARRLAQSPDIEFAEPNHALQPQQANPFPDDPLYSATYQPAASTALLPNTYQWALKNGEWPASTNVEAAWRITTGDPRIVVALIDSGFNLNHIDLKGRFLPGYDFYTSSDDRQPGRDPDPSDPSTRRTTNWHGTKVAGIVGAHGNNGAGIAGISWHTRLLPLRAMGERTGYERDIIAAMRWAVGLPVDGVADNPHPARILNVSSAGDGLQCSAAWRDAIRDVTRQNALIVIAAGNKGQQVAAPGNCPDVITVGSARFDGIKANYSNFGSEIDIMAPGGDCGRGPLPCQFQIVTTTYYNYTTRFNSNYNGLVGTSFAAPHVTGALALIWSANPDLSPQQVTTLLYKHANPFPTHHHPQMDVSIPGYPIEPDPLPVCTPGQTLNTPCVCTSDTCGHGLLNVAPAVEEALRTIPEAPTQPSDDISPLPTDNTSPIPSDESTPLPSEPTVTPVAPSEPPLTNETDNTPLPTDNTSPIPSNESAPLPSEPTVTPVVPSEPPLAKETDNTTAPSQPEIPTDATIPSIPPSTPPSTQPPQDNLPTYIPEPSTPPQPISPASEPIPSTPLQPVPSVSKPNEPPTPISEIPTPTSPSTSTLPTIPPTETPSTETTANTQPDTNQDIPSTESPSTENVDASPSTEPATSGSGGGGAPDVFFLINFLALLAVSFLMKRKT